MPIWRTEDGSEEKCIGSIEELKAEVEKFVGKSTKALGTAPKSEKDFRKVLESKDVDVITIATPDHWHAPMAILGLEAGKNVYVEKPCSHNPEEGAMLERWFSALR